MVAVCNGVSLGKWLVQIGQQANPKWSIAMRPSYRYTVNEEAGSVMLSMTFELKPNINPPADPPGMTIIQLAQRTFPDERECAMRVVRTVQRIRDVDNLLVEYQALKEQLRDAKADLLEAAGYDRQAYIDWVNAGEQPLPPLA